MFQRVPQVEIPKAAFPKVEVSKFGGVSNFEGAQECFRGSLRLGVFKVGVLKVGCFQG